MYITIRNRGFVLCSPSCVCKRCLVVDGFYQDIRNAMRDGIPYVMDQGKIPCPGEFLEGFG